MIGDYNNRGFLFLKNNKTRTLAMGNTSATISFLCCLDIDSKQGQMQTNLHAFAEGSNKGETRG